MPGSSVVNPLQQTMFKMPRTIVTSVHSSGDTAAAAADSLVTIFMFQNKMCGSARQVTRHSSADGHEDAVVVVDGVGGEGGQERACCRLCRPCNESRDSAARGAGVAVLAAGAVPRHNQQHANHSERQADLAWLARGDCDFPRRLELISQ